MSNLALLIILFLAEFCVLSLAAAIFFYRKAKKNVASEPGETIVAPPQSSVQVVEYSDNLHQQIQLTRDFIEQGDGGLVAQLRLQYLEAELAAYIARDEHPNWELLAMLLADRLPNIAVSDQVAMMAPVLDEVVPIEPEDQWPMLQSYAAEFVSTSYDFCTSVGAFCNKLGELEPAITSAEQIACIKPAISATLHAVMCLPDAPQDDLAQLAALLEQYQALQFNCTDLMVQETELDALQYYLGELVAVHQEIAILAVSLHLIEQDAALMPVVAPVDHAEMVTDALGDDDMQFMELEETPIDLSDIVPDHDYLAQQGAHAFDLEVTAESAMDEDAPIEVDLAALAPDNTPDQDAVLEQEIETRKAAMSAAESMDERPAEPGVADPDDEVPEDFRTEAFDHLPSEGDLSQQLIDLEQAMKDLQMDAPSQKT